MDPIHQYSMQTHLETSRWACRIYGKSQFASWEDNAFCGGNPKE